MGRWSIDEMFNKIKNPINSHDDIFMEEMIQENLESRGRFEKRMKDLK